MERRKCHGEAEILRRPGRGRRHAWLARPGGAVVGEGAAGIAGFEARSGAALRDLMDFAAGWLTVVRASGPDAVREAYGRLVAGTVPPSTGLVLSL